MRGGGEGYLWYSLVVDGDQFSRLGVDLQGLVECEGSLKGTLRTCSNTPSAVAHVPSRPLRSVQAWGCTHPPGTTPHPVPPPA